MRLFLIILVVLLSNGVYAQSSSVNLAIPSSPQSYQSDRVRSGQLECSQAIGSSTNVEFGVVGILNQNDPFGNNFNQMNQTNVGAYPEGYDTDGFVKDVGVYAKITIPIGAPKERLDCSLLYKLELRARELEVRKLEQELANLRNLRFADEK
jgi:hypothetical protein